MENRRKNLRSKLDSKLVIKRLDENSGEEDPSIELLDISKTGVGFNCSKPLTIGAVYEAFLTIWTAEVLHVFIEIVQIEKQEDTFRYGAIFVGMSNTEASRIGIYQTFDQENS